MSGGFYYPSKKYLIDFIGGLEMIVDTKFQNWVESLSQNYKKAQIKAAIHVNSELIKYYYELGKEIFNTSFKASYGSRFYDLLSIEFKKALPNVKD